MLFKARASANQHTQGTPSRKQMQKITRSNARHTVGLVLPSLQTLRRHGKYGGCDGSPASCRSSSSRSSGQQAKQLLIVVSDPHCICARGIIEGLAKQHDGHAALQTWGLPSRYIQPWGLHACHKWCSDCFLVLTQVATHLQATEIEVRVGLQKD